MCLKHDRDEAGCSKYDENHPKVNSGTPRRHRRHGKKRKENTPVHQALAPPSGGGPGSKFDSGLDSTLDSVFTSESPPPPPPPPMFGLVCFSSSWCR